MQIINASAWKSLTVAERIFYSPNDNIINLIKHNPDSEFWYTTYCAFACLIINGNTIDAIRDHFGLEPFFYCIIKDKYVFASNIRDILKHIPYCDTNNSQILRLLLNDCVGLPEYTDETYYKGIYRVEPGTRLRIKNNNAIDKICYWQLDPHSQPLMYSNDHDYIEHFDELLNESIKYQLQPGQKIAAEFSGGLDSSTVVTSLKMLNLNPGLFMHVAPDGSVADDSYYANKVINTLDFDKVYAIDAKEFDLLTAIQECSLYFAGTPNYIFPICARNVHLAVAKHGYNTLFSGFGGDECVSGHAPLRIAIAEYTTNKEFTLAWKELQAYYNQTGKIVPSKIKRFLQLLKFSQPGLFNLLNEFTSIPSILQHYIQSIPYIRSVKHVHSIKEHEYDLLQGKHSFHLRMRIEDSSIITKPLRIQYKYPLLYPKLVEFCFNLPLIQKRQAGINRCMIRRYLAKYLPHMVYQKHQKTGGIMPATMHKIAMAYKDNAYAQMFSHLPYEQQLNWIQNKYKIQRKFDRKILLLSLKLWRDDNSQE